MTWPQNVGNRISEDLNENFLGEDAPGSSLRGPRSAILISNPLLWNPGSAPVQRNDQKRSTDSFLDLVHITLEKFENAALFLRPLFTFINLSQKRSFSKTLLKPEEFHNASFAFSPRRRTF